MKRVCVIGAGPSGLASIKSCKEEDIEVVCFERTKNIGGLWHYHKEEDVASVMKNTIINTSKEMCAFSDFPPPKDFPNYMHNQLMLKYFKSYAEHFELMQYIRFEHEVTQVIPHQDYEATGQWLVTYTDCSNQSVTEETFDGVMICTGHHVKPHIPTFSGQEVFKGRIVHSQCLKTTEEFRDRKVLVVGIGNSGMDISVEISNFGKEVYLSTRRGSWLAFRVGSDGLPMDLQVNTRLNAFLIDTFGLTISNWYAEWLLNSKFDHKTYGLKPDHRAMDQHPSINDTLPVKIISGGIILRRNIKRFVENGVIFEGDDETVAEVDAVILATGYKIVFPFLGEDILKTQDNKVDLYMNSFPPSLKHPSLVFIGLIQTFGAIFPIAESQTRWYAQLMKGNVQLPPVEEMIEDIRRRNCTKSRFVDSPRHTIQVENVPFLNDLAAKYGAKPNLVKMALVDPKLFWTCYFGPCLSYQYRLQGPHAWSGAREAVLNYQERVLFPLKAPKSHIK